MITDAKITDVRNDRWGVKTVASTYPQGLLPLLNGCRKKKKKTSLAIRALLISPTSTLTPLLHPPTTTYICPVANSLIVTATVTGAAGWGCRVPEAGGGISHPSMPSHRASWPCQPSLSETVKTFPFEGVLWCSFEQSIPKTSSVELPFSHGQSLPRSGENSGSAAIWGLFIQRQLSLLTLCFC